MNYFYERYRFRTSRGGANVAVVALLWRLPLTQSTVLIDADRKNSQSHAALEAAMTGVPCICGRKIMRDATRSTKSIEDCQLVIQDT